MDEHRSRARGLARLEFERRMARIIPIWRSEDFRVYRFDHPVEHEDQPYEARADAYRASFVEIGRFNLEVGERRWRVRPGDVMLSHPGMRYRASFEGRGFNDRCISLVYVGGEAERFKGARASPLFKSEILPASNRLHYLRWLLQRADAQRAPMLAEYVASEIFRDLDAPTGEIFREHKFAWYAERVHAARERLDAEYDREHTVGALARAVGMSTFHFTRVFTALVGRPPHRYLTERRLAAARSMLTQGRSVTETCFACGFNNLSHFSRSFARRFGVSPSQVSR